MIDTKKEIKPVQIDFDEATYSKAITDYGRRVTVETKIRDEYKELLGVKFEKKDYKDILQAFWRELKKQNKPLLDMGVVLEKIPEIKGLDLTDLKSYAQQYETVKHYDSPNGDSFKTYAVTAEEIKKFNACMKVIEALQELETYAKVYPRTIVNACSYAFKFDMRKGIGTETLKPNAGWIQGKRF